MSHEPSSERKRKPVEELDVTINSDDQSPKISSKARRVTLDSSMTLSHISSLQQNVPIKTERVATAKSFSASNAHEQEASMERIREKIQDLSGSDNVEINAALVALSMDLKNDPTTCDNIFKAGGCRALVQLLKNCLEKAIDEIPACDQITRLNKLAELQTLHKALRVIIGLTFQHDESRVEIASIGGVRVVVKVMKTLPKCQILQKRACDALCHLTWCSIGKTKAIESCGIEALLAAIDNHLGSAYICKIASWALFNIVIGSKENTELLISLGGVAAVLKVRTKWPDIDEVHKEVLRHLTVEMTGPQPISRSSEKSSEAAIPSPETPASSSLPPATKVATGSLSRDGAIIEILDDSDDEDDQLRRESATQEPIARPPVGRDEPLAGRDKPLAGRVPALSFQPTAAEDTTASPTVPTLSSPSTLGVYHESSDGVSPSLNVPTVPSTPRNVRQLSEVTPDMVSEQSRNDHKCKPTESPEAVVLESTGEGERNAMKVVTRSSLSLRERKSHDARMMDAATSTVASLQMKAQVVTDKDSLLSQSTLGVYHESSDGFSHSPKVPTVPSKPRNDNQLKPETTLELASEKPRNDRKCKPTEAPQVAVLESTGEVERNATKAVISSKHSLRERLRQRAAHITATQPTMKSSCKSSKVAIASPETMAFSSLPTATKVATGSLEIPALSFQPPAAEDTTASLAAPTISSQATLGKVLAVPSTPRNDSQLPDATPDVLSQQPRHHRKCKSTEAPEAVVLEPPEAVVLESPKAVVLESTGEGERTATKAITRSNRSLRERKSHNTQTDASTSPVASPQMHAQLLTERESTADAAVFTPTSEKEESTANAEPEHQIQSIGTLIQDSTTVDAAVHALRVDLMEDSTVMVVGGCFAVVPIMWLVVKEMIRWISDE